MEGGEGKELRKWLLLVDFRFASELERDYVPEKIRWARGGDG